MLNLICFVVLFVAGLEACEIGFIHSPDNVKFKGHDQLDHSLLKDIFSFTLGFTTLKSHDWDGIFVSNPFHFAEAVVYLEIDGIDTLNGLSGHRFPVYNDEEEDETWQILRRRIRFRYPSQNNTLLKVDLIDGLNALEPYHTALGDVEVRPASSAYSALDSNVTEDHEFLSEIALLQAIIRKVESTGDRRDGIPDVYWFVLYGLHSIINFHGADSAKAQEAKEILTDTIADMNNAFVSAYNGQVLVSVFTSNVNHIRQTRSLKAEDDEGKGINISKNYDADYPVIFNILLWFMVTFTFTILAVSVGIASMDPGRDSIIYRMTSNRMKKDN